MRSRILALLASFLGLFAPVATAVSVTTGGLYELTDDELSGPEQPIQFSHRKHFGQLKIECLYCYSTADKSQTASVPAVSVCMGCHQWVKHSVLPPGIGPLPEAAEIVPASAEPPGGAAIPVPGVAEPIPGSAEEIAKIQEHVDQGRPIEWVRAHWVPEYVQFKHKRHVLAKEKIECQECHGPVEEMNRIWMSPDTRYNSSSAFLPAAKLEMGWCVDCHDQKKEATQDCVACHH
jgi:hypothetical protein